MEDRIRKRAHQIWEREGRPEGRSDDHWKLASEEIAIEDNYRQTLLPNPAGGPDATAARTEPVEPALAMANLGEMPGLTDQGESFRIPGIEGSDPMPDPQEAGAQATIGNRARRKTRGRGA
ncbi:DUF2934 domain-containing protein [Azospirillum sp. SYSU D00513]|uniref:DUF2934 domain-containing protein n=1 Tax=Azospirillum sp. SYSU D00513 TaxID=2812561 RepID=UPI001FFE4985|nr:DUF2934 domain-containing protein [Azospirillum sp. SYSU D00513]